MSGPDWNNERVNPTDSGILVIDKPSKMTSHQVVGRIRRVFGTRKVGHAGTLDPMATGVLIIGLNRATRLLGHLALHDKAYRATIRLGASTTTDDAGGTVVTTCDASRITRDQIEVALEEFRGDIWQVPSAVSAIKVDGKRAYARVRAGEDVELTARPVTINRFEVTALRVEGSFLDLDVEVECTSGTYIRALARDLGHQLAVGGHLTALRRTRIGNYGLDLACELGSLDGAGELMSMAQAAGLSFTTLTLDAEQARDVGYGRALDVCLPATPTGLLSPGGDLLALYDRSGRPIAVLVG